MELPERGQLPDRAADDAAVERAVRADAYSFYAGAAAAEQYPDAACYGAAESVRPAHRAGTFDYPLAEHAAAWNYFAVCSGVYIDPDARGRAIEQWHAATAGHGRHARVHG